MQKNAALVQSLCLPHCRYYNQGIKEELTCRGAVIVERLTRAGHNLEGASPGISRRPDDKDSGLASRLCVRCDFRAEDCDFAEDGVSEPCGGFLLIAGLLRMQVITLEDVEAADRMEQQPR